MNEPTVCCCKSNIELAKENIAMWITSTLQYYRSNYCALPSKINELVSTANELILKLNRLHKHTEVSLISDIAKYTELSDKAKDPNYRVVYKEYLYALQMELQLRSLEEVAA